MNKYIYILLILLSVAVVSCSVPFDLDLDDEPLIYLASFPGEDAEVVTFDVRPAYSKSNSALKPDFKPEIKFMVNGERIPVALNTDKRISDRYRESYYIADYSSKPGDRMSIEVSSEGFKTIYAETVVPKSFPDRKIDFRHEVYGKDEYNVLSVSLNDDEDDDYAYGLQILEESCYYFPDTTHVNQYRKHGEQMSHYYDLASVSLEGIRLEINNYYVSAWDDDMFNGNSTELSVVLPHYTYNDSDSYDEFLGFEAYRDYYDEEGNVLFQYRYTSRNKLILYTMSKECYKYKLAEELISDNSDFVAGLAPANFCYSNIENGYGAFAGLSVVETDWITREFIENNR